MDRIILHCDLNSFYASVELRSRPDLQNVPVAVCGDPTSRHGIILAKNEPAKKFGVQTAETIWQAKKKCPELVLLPPHHKLYRQVSKEVNTIYEQYTDLVEPFGIDESWLDVTHTLHLFGGDAKALADHLRQRMKQEMGLTLSVGVSFNKVFAKLGSDYKKPDATTVISREQVPQILWPLPVTDLLFVGRASARMLAEHHIHTIGDLARACREDLKKWLGKHGEQLHDAANGWDHSLVRPAGETPPPKSVGNGLTFRRNLTGAEEIQAGAQLLAERVALRLRRHQLKCTTVQVSLRSPEFKTIQRQKGTPAPTNVSRVIFQCVVELLEGTWNWSAPLRAMTITAAGLVPEEEAGEQLDLFTPQAAVRRGKQEKLERTMDALRDRYGPHVIGYASRQTQTAREIAGDETGKRKEESP
ncbi:DNA polymerase IV [Evtepia gabavorous]|uniref:DNA polymerase IV n=1 Tax=Evtepia gabavorous TaxID=2211183 RepID=UPI003AF0D870